MPTAKGVLKAAFTLGVVGVGLTLGGTLLGPFLTASAGQAAAVAGATHGSILSSFHSLLLTDVNGVFDIGGGLAKMGNGALAIFGSGFEVLGSGVSAGIDGSSILGAMGEAWNAPIHS